LTNAATGILGRH